MKSLTPVWVPVIIARGVTAPGLTPRFSINLSAEPKDNLLVPSIVLSVLRSIFLSCSATKRILRFFYLEDIDSLYDPHPPLNSKTVLVPF